jgi:hypothetical protein
MINLDKIPKTLKRPLETDFRHFFFYKKIANTFPLKTILFTKEEVTEVINYNIFNNDLSFTEYSINFNQIFINEYNQLLREKLKIILLLTSLRVENILKIHERIKDINFSFSENLENSLNIMVEVENLENDFIDLYMFTNQDDWKEFCKKDSLEFKEIR